MILTVTLNPSVDHALFVDVLKIGDTNRVSRAVLDAGGKGINVSRVVKGLDGETLATGFLGGGNGAYVREILDRESVHHDFVSTKGETRINISIETIDGSPPTCLNEPGPTVLSLELNELVRKVEQLLPRCRWLVLAGSLPPGVPQDIFAQLGCMARSAGVRFVLDADGPPMIHGMECGPSLIKPNSKEAGRILGRSVSTLDEAILAAKELRGRLPAADKSPYPVVVVSRGEDGAVMVSGDGIWIGESPSIHALSTVGSGDSMVGAMTYSLDRGIAACEALRYGLAAGAATASMKGTGIASRASICALLNRARYRQI